MLAMILRLLKSARDDKQYEKSFECVTRVRTAAIEEDEAKTYNE